jgi:hypothetical protein
MAQKKRIKDYAVIIERPVGHTMERITKTGEFMSRKEGQKFMKQLLPRYPKKMFKTRLKKFSPIEKKLNIDLKHLIGW